MKVDRPVAVNIVHVDDGKMVIVTDNSDNVMHYVYIIRWNWKIYTMSFYNSKLTVSLLPDWSAMDGAYMAMPLYKICREPTKTSIYYLHNRLHV